MIYLLIHLMLFCAIIWRVGMIVQLRDYCWYDIPGGAPRYITFCSNVEIMAIIFGVFTNQWWMYLSYGLFSWIGWRVHYTTKMQHARRVALTDLTLTCISISIITYTWLRDSYGL